MAVTVKALETTLGPGQIDLCSDIRDEQEPMPVTVDKPGSPRLQQDLEEPRQKLWGQSFCLALYSLVKIVEDLHGRKVLRPSPFGGSFNSKPSILT